MDIDRIDKLLKAIKETEEEHFSPSSADRNYLTENEVNQLIKAAGGQEHSFPPPDVSYDRHRNHKPLTHAELWKDWSSWLAACKWEHLSVLVACQEALQKVLETHAQDVVEEIGKAFSGLDFSNTRWEEESRANLKFHVTNFCQMAYRAYSMGEDKLFDDLFDSIDWVFADAEVNFAYMGLCAISKIFYKGTDKENREL